MHTYIKNAKKRYAVHVKRHTMAHILYVLLLLACVLRHALYFNIHSPSVSCLLPHWAADPMHQCQCRKSDQAQQMYCTLGLHHTLLSDYRPSLSLYNMPYTVSDNRQLTPCSSCELHIYFYNILMSHFNLISTLNLQPPVLFPSLVLVD